MTEWRDAWRLLGVSPSESADPYALLGLPSTPASHNDIERALHRRLAALDRRSGATRHELDEARRALHSAAAQLADPDVQKTLLHRFEEIRALDTIGDPRTDHHRTGLNPRAEHFRPLARRVLALHGRLTHESRLMLFALAQSHGLSTQELLATLRSLSRPKATTAPHAVPPGAGARESVAGAPGHALNGRATLGAAPPPPVYAGIEAAGEAARRRARGRIRDAAIVSLTVAILGVLLFGGFLILLPGDRAASTAKTPAPGAPPAASIPADRADARDEADAPEPFDAAATLAALREAAPLLAESPGDAAWRFEEAHRALASNWTELSLATRRAAIGAIARFIVDTTPGAESWSRSVEAVIAGSAALERLRITEPEVRPAVWSTGVMTRLLATPALPARTATRLEGALATALPAGRPPGHPHFASGAAAAIEAMINVLPIDSREGDTDSVVAAWSAWIDAVDVVARIEPAEGAPLDREEILLAAAERLLLRAASPAVDATTRAALRSVLAALPWDAAAPGSDTARTRILRWLEDPTIRPADLAVVTDWLVRETSAALPRRLILAPTASMAQRLELRTDYGALWGLAAATVAEAEAESWLQRVRDELAEREVETNVTGALARAVILSRLSQAAAALWAGDAVAARAILGDPDEPVQDLIDAQRTARSPTRRIGDDGEWALRYLSIEADQPSRRLAALAWLEQRSGPIGPVDADVLAEAALFRGRPPVRSAAVRNVEQRQDQVWMINAVLEAAQRSPATPEGSALIERMTGVSLPAANSRAWRQAAVDALRERLVVRLAEETDWGVADDLGAILTTSYHARAMSLTRPGAVAPVTPSEPLQAAAILADRWIEEAARVVLVGDESLPDVESIERRREARRRLAQDPIQRFAAEQAAACEAMARVVGWERPARARDVADALRALSIDRTRAPNVGAQIHATARAFITLWTIRLDLDVPPARASEGGPEA